MTPDLFITAARDLGVTLDDRAIERFDQYEDALRRGNERTNLTRIEGREAVFTKHFLDSLSCFRVLDATLAEFAVVDVGSGPGLPGLAIAIVCPHWRVALVESTERKAAFLAETVTMLDLANVTVKARRAEDVGHDPALREQFDLAIARAVARTNVLAEYLLPLVAVDGRAVAMKGTDPTEEAAETPFETFGGRLESVERVDVPGVDGERHLVVATKTDPTPERFPRRAGIPAKRPMTRRSP